MAFTNSPTNDTYSTHQLPLVSDLEFRPGDVTFSLPMSGMYNVFPFQDGDQIIGESRNGLEMVQVGTATTPFVRGMYVWEKSVGTVYYFMVTASATETHVFTSTDGITWTDVNSWSTTDKSPARFTEFIDDTNTKSLILVDGTKGFVYTSDAAGTEITDTDFPSPHVPFPVFLDGYLFLAKTGTGDIYNSNLNDPTSWTAGSFLSSELYPDDIQALLKINNYILAIGTQASEFFYDAAVATGSPLARYEGGTLPFGTTFPNSIAATKELVMLLANNNDGESVFKLIEGFKHSEFPADTVLRALSRQIRLGTTTAPRVRGSFIRQNGELFYIFVFDGLRGTVTSQYDTAPSLAASLKHKIWIRVTTTGSDDNGYVDYCWPVFFSAPSTSGNLYTFVAGSFNHPIDALNVPAERALFGFISPVTNDSLGGYTFTLMNYIYVKPQAFGTLNQKTMSRVGVNYASTNAEINRSVSGITIYLQTSDNMMLDFSEARSLAGDTDRLTDVFPFITQLGMFRQRGFKIYSDGLKRWYYLETDINKGQK